MGASMGYDWDGRRTRRLESIKLAAAFLLSGFLALAPLVVLGLGSLWE
ncbi:hypothetical protein EV286_11132 [Rhizobium sp. BK251]|nr:hypothetical protein EV286_11132 [Rhizobium sp. BK251]